MKNKNFLVGSCYTKLFPEKIAIFNFKSTLKKKTIENCTRNMPAKVASWLPAPEHEGMNNSSWLMREKSGELFD